MNRRQLLPYTAIVALLGVALAAAGQTQPKPAQKKDAKQPSTATHANNGKQSEGERIFAQNCARCHNPPDGFSPRISGTIVLHMRVRAALSAHDEQELLRYFNP